MTLKTIKLALADDHAIDRAMLLHQLKACPHFEILFFATNGKDFLYKLPFYQPDVMIIDIYMPVLNGWEVCDHLYQQGHPGKLLLMSNSYESDLMNKLIQKNVGGFCRKEFSFIKQAIEALASNQNFYDDSYHLHPSNPFALQHEEFSGMEITLLNLLAEGFTCKEMADQIRSLSVRTIETYLHRLIKRYHLKNRAHLVSFAYMNGLLHSHLPFKQKDTDDKL